MEMIQATRSRLRRPKRSAGLLRQNKAATQR
jgi:hypothetical protein